MRCSRIRRSISSSSADVAPWRAAMSSPAMGCSRQPRVPGRCGAPDPKGTPSHQQSGRGHLSRCSVMRCASWRRVRHSGHRSIAATLGGQVDRGLSQPVFLSQQAPAKMQIARNVDVSITQCLPSVDCFLMHLGALHGAAVHRRDDLVGRESMRLERLALSLAPDGVVWPRPGRQDMRFISACRAVHRAGTTQIGSAGAHGGARRTMRRFGLITAAGAGAGTAVAAGSGSATGTTHSITCRPLTSC